MSATRSPPSAPPSRTPAASWTARSPSASSPRRRASPADVRPAAHPLRRPGRLPAAHRARGGVALHAAGPLPRAARRRRRPAPGWTSRPSCPRASSSLELPAADVDVPLPVDRLAALALQRAPYALVLRVPKGAEPTEPVVLRLTGTGGDEVVWGHVVLDVAEQARVTVVVEHSGSAKYAAVVSALVGDGAALDLVQVQEWDRDAVHGSHLGSRLGRDARLRSHRRHARRRPRAAVRDRRLHRDRRRRRAARRDARRGRPAPRAPPAGRPLRAELPQPRHVQGGAAGRRGAHRLGRRRRDPRGRLRHRHVRAEPQPAAHARGARRLGAEPRDRDRRDLRRRATPAPPAGSTTTSSST